MSKDKVQTEALAMDIRPNQIAFWRRRLRNLISQYPIIYLPLARTIHGDHVVSHKTELVIEGFPRCANSFAESAFRLAQPNPVRLAHHCHAAAQVIAAVRWHIPTLVSFRNSDDAVLSLLEMRPNIYSPYSCFQEYLGFYRPLIPYRSGYVLASFESVTTRFGDVIRKINERFLTSFAEYKQSEEMNEKTFHLIDQLTLERLGRSKTNYSRTHSIEYEEQRTKQRNILRERLLAPQVQRVRGQALDLFARLQETADL